MKSVLEPLFALLCLALVASASVGCARRQAIPDGIVTLAILDARVADPETRKSSVGWWLSSRERWDNGNAGVVAGEALAREFDRLPNVEVYSRTELTAFMAAKERVLAQAYDGLTPEERLVVLQNQDPLDYGRALDVDYILSGDIERSRTVRQGTVGTWQSSAALDLSLREVRSGEEIWRWSGRDTDLFSSQVGVIEDLAARARRDLQKTIVLQPTLR